MAVSQSIQALQIANQHRLAAYAERKRLREMTQAEARVELAKLLLEADDPAVLCGRVADFLMCPRQYGIGTAQRLMRAADIRRADARLRDLTPRQRCVLADAVLPKGSA